MSPDTARALAAREAAFADGPEGREGWRACVDCGAAMPREALVHGICPRCEAGVEPWYGDDCDGAL